MAGDKVMAIDPVNWRREMKKLIGAELNALKDENFQLRAEVQNLSTAVKSLRNEISQIYTALNSIEEMTRILAANSMLTNLERNFSSNVESKPVQKMETTKPAKNSVRKKIAVFGMRGAEVNVFCEVAKSRNLPVDLVVTNDVHYFADSAIFIVTSYKSDASDKYTFKTLCQKYEKIFVVVDDIVNSEVYSSTPTYTKFKNSVNDYLNWDKIMISYVNLKNAAKAQRTGDSVLFQWSNFPEFEEKFFRNM